MASDAELIRESGRRPDAFVEVCRWHAGDLSGWLRREVGGSVADDLLAETFARAWFARRRFRDPGTGSAGPWFQGIARNVVREYRRDGVFEGRAIRKLGLPRASEDTSILQSDERLDAAAEYACSRPWSRISRRSSATRCSYESLTNSTIARSAAG